MKAKPAPSSYRLLGHRFFFALMPGDAARDRMALHARRQVQGDAAKGGRCVRPDHLHITLAILDDVAAFGAPFVDRLMAVGAAVRAGPCEVVLDRERATTRSTALCPLGRQPDLRALHGELDMAMKRAGLTQREGWSFSPHATLFYRDGLPGVRDLDQPFRWTAREFVLVHSYLGLTRHDIIARWPLRGGDQLPLL